MVKAYVGIVLKVAQWLWRQLYPGPWIDPWGENILASIEGKPWYKTEKEALSWLVRRIIQENVYSQKDIKTLEEEARYVDSWVNRWLDDERLPEDAKTLSGRYLELEQQQSYRDEYEAFGGARIALECMTCLLVVKFRNVGKGIGYLIKLSDTNGQLTRLDHGFWCRLTRRWFCNQPHHAVSYKLEPEAPNLPPGGVPIRAGDEGYTAKFLLRLQLDRDYQGIDDGKPIRDILAWADFFDFAKRGMRGKVRLKYTAQHGKWFWDQQREGERPANVSIRIPLPSERVNTCLARELAGKAQSLYNYHRNRVATEVETGDDK